MAKLLSAYGYQGDAMNLPVTDVVTAALYYVRHMGFTIVEQDSDSGEPPNEDAIKSVILERDGILMALAENGGDPTQDGCAFHVTGLAALFAEFYGHPEKPPEFKSEQHGEVAWKVFYVVAPDGLCYWFGERQAGSGAKPLGG